MSVSNSDDKCRVFSPSSAGLRQTIDQLKIRIQTYDTARARKRTSSAIVRGSISGLAFRGGLNLVSYLVAMLSKRPRHARPPARDLVKDALRWGAFLGSFSGIFVASDEIIACLGGRKRTAAWRALVSGALAGPTILLTGTKTTHTSLALYVFIRAMVLLVRCGNLPTAAPWKRKLLAPTRWQHGDVALMCLSTIQLGYSWIVCPSTLPPSYVRFLNKHGGKDLQYMDAVREMCHRHAAGVPPGRLRSLRGTPHEKFTGKIPCEFLHPGTTCSEHTMRFLPEAYLRALPVYIPVYIIPAAIVHRQKLLDPGARQELWTKMALGMLRSSAFLSLYCALAWRGACCGFTTAGHTSGAVIAASCWTAGLATMVEKKSRRMELALYCLSRSVEAFSLCLVTWGVVPKKVVPQRLDVVLFSLATATICHCYSDRLGARREVFRKKFLTGFDFVFGNTGFDIAEIQHLPSNGELLVLVKDRVLKSMTNLAGIADGSTGGESMPVSAVSSLSNSDED